MNNIFGQGFDSPHLHLLERKCNYMLSYDKKQVENIWKTEWINKHSAFDHRIFICSQCRKQISIQGEPLDFCPSCGSAKTDRAVDIIVQRLDTLLQEENA